MRIAVLGGGPGGLYSALLLKKVRRDSEVVLFESNPAGSTYGWGVVFSDRTLTSFREADHKTFHDISESFVLWDAIDVRFGGETVRSGGHVFAGIARRALLGILAARCEELGVRLFWSSPSDVSQLSGFDLVVAADGVHSSTRRRFEKHFRPSASIGKTRYIWFGTHKPFGAFTFIFRTGDHGLFQVHAYPFDGSTSTFIVECEEQVWRRAGLHEAGEEESIAYCEKLFAEDLRGHSLMSNQSKWVRFATIKNRSWSRGHIVLLGDAPHTAHFTIGSGTKLAMEDAIALAAALDQHGDVETSLAHYEMERRPILERFQSAAAESQSYFEGTARYLHLEPKQFAFYLLTRSGRIDYGSLRQRDPVLVDGIDSWFSGSQSGKRHPLVAPPPMFAALSLRSVSILNRAAVAPAPTYSSSDGAPSDRCLKRLLAAAHAGPGLVVTEPVAVGAAARVTPGDPGIYRREHALAWSSLAERVHGETSAKLCLRLGHAGRRGGTRVPHRGLGVPLGDEAWSLIAPSPLPYRSGGPVPRGMDETDMEEVIGSFVAGAELAAQAGVDVLEIHMAHGYLLGSFISPLSNRRSDDYGGCLANRLRFPLEVFERVRSVWPEERPLAIALNADDWARGGCRIEDAIEAAAAFKRRGCDLIDVLAGQTTPASRPSYEPGFLAGYSDSIRNQARVATMTSGNITTTVQVNTLIAAGRADLCVLTR